jgi:uncharacterized membrane protein
MTDPRPTGSTDRPPDPAMATILLGLGLGGFFDGIVLHQVLQWHHLLSAHVAVDTVEGLQVNTLADGLFHAATWVFTVVGVVLLYRQVRDGASIRWRGLAGGLLTGWGAFNVVEGLVNHQLLGLHHVRPGPGELLYDIGFLVVGAVFVVLGMLLLRPSAARSRSGT